MPKLIARLALARAGFVPSRPFAGHPDSPSSPFPTLDLDPVRTARAAAL